MTLPRHDFTQPPPLAPQLRVNLAQWLKRSNALLVELLAGAAVSVELQFDCSSTMMPTQLTTEWTDKSLALQLKLGQHDAQSLVALPNPLVQELIGCILGDPPHKIPVERSLTAAELSVAEVIAEMIMRSLKESWQGDVPLNLALGETESNLRRTKRFRPKESMIVCRSITSQFIFDLGQDGIQSFRHFDSLLDTVKLRSRRFGCFRCTPLQDFCRNFKGLAIACPSGPSQKFRFALNGGLQRIAHALIQHDDVADSQARQLRPRQLNRSQSNFDPGPHVANQLFQLSATGLRICRLMIPNRQTKQMGHKIGRQQPTPV
jgi:hypothetical protein